MASDLSANDRGRLAIHTPVWDHNDLGFRLECGCGEFTHGGVDRAAAERRWVDHIAPTVERILAVHSADMEAQRDAASMRSGEWARRNWNASADMEARIRALHERVSGSPLTVCSHDGMAWPCPTIALLDAAPAGGAEWPCGGRIVCPDPDCQRCKLDAPSEVPHD